MSFSTTSDCRVLSAPALVLLVLAGVVALGGCAADWEEPAESEGSATQEDETSSGPEDPSTQEEDSSTTEEEEEEEEIEEDFLPIDGDWVVTESELVLDGCGLEDWVDRGQPGSILDLVNTGDRSFEMTFEAGEGETVACDLLETLEYDCETVTTTDSTLTDLGLQGSILVDYNSNGAFEAEDVMILETVLDIDCQGQDCYLAVLFMGTEFPCQMGMRSALDLQTPR